MRQRGQRNLWKRTRFCWHCLFIDETWKGLSCPSSQYDWSIDWFIHYVIDFIDWLIDWLVGLLIAWLIGWLSIDWLIEWNIFWNFWLVARTQSSNLKHFLFQDNKVSHYIINKVTDVAGSTENFTFKIGDQDFKTLPELLTFYKFHYLDSTPLIRPASKKLEQVMTKYEFTGRDLDDLPFLRGEVLTIIRKGVFGHFFSPLAMCLLVLWSLNGSKMRNCMFDHD